MDKHIKKSNEFIKRRKRKILIRRSILISTLLFATLVTLCLKLPFFNIVNINVINNKNVPSEIVEKLSGVNRGNNIFYINTRTVKNNITSNPYISSVKLLRKFPATVVLDIKERDATYYVNENNKYYVLDSNGIILELRDSIENMQLIKVEGLKIANADIGKNINAGEVRKLEVLANLADLIRRNISGINMDSVDINSVTDIKVYSSQLCFKVGDSFEMDIKLNKALNIASKDDLKGKKGYIDVSFGGNPVFYTE